MEEDFESEAANERETGPVPNSGQCPCYFSLSSETFPAPRSLFHPPYAFDLVPADFFFLFPKVKIVRRIRRIRNIEWNVTAELNAGLRTSLI